MSKAYYVKLVDGNGHQFDDGYLEVNEAGSTLLRKVKASSNSTIAYRAADLPDDVYLKVSISQQGTLLSKNLQRETTELAHRLGYRVRE